VDGDTRVSVCLDVVDGIGALIELERLIRPEESGEAVQHGLDELVRSLGVPVERMSETYDSLVPAVPR
jgi:adenylate cyclase class 2